MGEVLFFVTIFAKYVQIHFHLKKKNTKFFFKKEVSRTDGFTGEFYPMFKESMPIIHSLFQKIRESIFPFHFMRPVLH